jgi:hypothetical protein
MKVLVITNMYPTPHRVSYGTFVEEQVISLREAGIQVEVFIIAGGGIKNYLKAIRALRRFLSDKSYDLLHAHYGLSGFVARMQIRYPVVITFHGSDLMWAVDAYARSSWLTIATSMISNMAALSAAQCIVEADFLKPALWSKSAVTIPVPGPGWNSLRLHPLQELAAGRAAENGSSVRGGPSFLPKNEAELSRKAFDCRRFPSYP